MKNYVLSTFVLLIVGCGNQNKQHNTNTDSIKTEMTNPVVERVSKNNNILDVEENIESLNSIRFGDWTDDDWYDNDYFRTLRKYIDACYKGEIENKELEPYKSALKGKFAIFNAEPYIAGGMFISIIFLEAPNKIFDISVYSSVDVDTRTVVDYHVRSVIPREHEESGLTKNDILTIIKEHPENKLW